jgi:hypothetical protein
MCVVGVSTSATELPAPSWGGVGAGVGKEGLSGRSLIRNRPYPWPFPKRWKGEARTETDCPLTTPYSLLTTPP